MLDFQKLRGGPDGWRGSFERLIRHLAEINPPAGAAEFRAIEGAGGDGGIEAYWVRADGREVGYQAKFHLRPGDIDWAALDASVQTALVTHPELACIVVAMPCDLSDVRKGRGTSAREKWNARRARWIEEAKPRAVTFEFVGQSQIELMLAAPRAVGLRQYWFADTEMSDQWFLDQFARTISALDERYHPEDHVDVQAQELFRALLGSPDWRRDYERRAGDAVKAMPTPPDPDSASATAHSALAAAVAELAGLAADKNRKSEASFPTQNWLDAIDRAIGVTRGIASGLEAAEAAGGGGYALRAQRDEIVELETILSVLRARLGSAYQRADDMRYSIIEGAAGSGKSHLMAAEVEAALTAGQPAIMLLGTDFASAEEPGSQIARRLDLSDLSGDALLGALEAAAASRQTRALIAIDALNEGGGGGYWRERLAAFARQVRRYPRLTLCVSCRDVYADRIFTAAARVDAAELEIEGFATEEEQERAASVYMDRRGIARPASPWLPPEFVNPLFLRTTCVALERKGIGQFPLGLRGSREMLRFYLDAAATTLGTCHDGTAELEAPLIRGVLGIAREMARSRRDYIERPAATRIIDQAFQGYHPPSGMAWVDVLRLRGLLRADPPEIAESEPDDPLAAHDDVLRFSFQRVQDQLIAKALTQDCAGPEGMFAEDASLAFLIGDWGIEYEWRGVFAALGIIFADEWQVEIVDHLPGEWSDWWNDEAVQEAFAESILWRQRTSFHPRTRALLEALEWPRTATDFLIELSVVEDHPWNADMLHQRLAPHTMSVRDALWTRAVNDDARGKAMRLAKWAFRSGPASANEEMIRLALTSYGWLFTSTNVRLRDHATKAATELLLLWPAAHEAFLARFADVDDVYVVERVLAAMAGACLRDPSPARLGPFAGSIWRHVFSKEKLPTHLLLLDYARLIVELAADRGVLPPSCDLTRCRPPYGSAAPRFGLTEGAVEAQCKAVGDRSIFSSVAGWSGDFGDYIVKGRIRAFTSARRTRERPLRHEEAFAQFKADFCASDEYRSTLLSILELTIPEPPDDADNDDDIGQGNPWTDMRQQAEAELLRRLGARGRRRYQSDARPFLNGRKGWPGGGELGLIDQKQARLWIARRAIQLGWTGKLFPNDYGGGDGSTRSKAVERIGKKYQWIAYHELMARLADNYWLAPEWGAEPTRAYDTPIDLPFTRDLDPTVLPIEEDDREPNRSDCPRVPLLTLKAVATADMYDWVFEDRVAADRLELGLCGDLGDQAGQWITLYRYASHSTKHEPASERHGAPCRLNDFHFILMAGIEPAKVQSFAVKARKAGADFHDWMTWGDLTDGPFLYEAGNRSTWPESEWITSDSFRSVEQRYLRFSREYRWEHHLDGTLPEGVSLQVPSPWLLRELALLADPRSPGIYVDAAGRPIIVSSVGDRNAYCLARRDAVEALLLRRRVTPVWVGVGERGAWPDPAENAGPNRRWNGVHWRDDDGPRHEIWSEDHRPGGFQRVVRRHIELKDRGSRA